MYIIKSSSHTVNDDEKAQETKPPHLEHHSLLPLQTRQDCQMVVHQTVLHLSHQLPDTADGDGTSANCGMWDVVNIKIIINPEYVLPPAMDQGKCVSSEILSRL